MEVVILPSTAGCNVFSKELYKNSGADYKAIYIIIKEWAGVQAAYYLIISI
jgi:hypothetical protein